MPTFKFASQSSIANKYSSIPSKNKSSVSEAHAYTMKEDEMPTSGEKNVLYIASDTGKVYIGQGYGKTLMILKGSDMQAATEIEINALFDN